MTLGDIPQSTSSETNDILMMMLRQLVANGSGSVAQPDQPARTYTHVFSGSGATPQTEADIFAGNTMQIVSGADITIDFSSLQSAQKVWMAQLNSEPLKTFVYMTNSNSFLIGPGQGIESVQTIGQYALYVWAYPTEFRSSTIYKKQQ